MNSDKPVVAHVIRGYLARTETFIGNQIVTLQNFQPIVACHHHRLDKHSYPLEHVFAGKELLPISWKIMDDLAYRFCRWATPVMVEVLAGKIRENSAELLHFHYLVDARFFLTLKKKTRLPGIVSAYGYDVSSFPKMYGGYGRYYLQPLFGIMDYFLAMSQDMRQDLIALGCPDEKVIVHYHGIDTRRFIYPERDYTGREVLTILACGTLEIKKGQHLTLQALRFVEQKHLSQVVFKVVFVGDGPMRTILEQMVKEFGWENKVNFRGYIPHHEKRLVQAYRQADIFSLPAITVDGDKEGIPGTIIEAMTSGLPVVSSYHAGIPEIIENGKDGLLVKEGDVQSLAHAFADLLNDTRLRQELGQNAAHRAVNNLDLQQGTANLEAIYHKVIGR